MGAGIPTVFIEMLIGQYSSQGILSVWNVVPLFKGIGIGFILFSFFTSTWYGINMSWTIMYLTNSAKQTPNFVSCCNYWNSDSECELQNIFKNIT